jgi:hypothetical protein
MAARSRSIQSRAISRRLGLSCRGLWLPSPSKPQIRPMSAFGT